MTVNIDVLLGESRRNDVSITSPTPLYYQLCSTIKNYILDGTLRFGEKLPSEAELADSFNVSRITVKRALNELALENLVERARGRGTHVIYKYSPKPVQAPLLGILEEIDSIATNSIAKVISCEILNPPNDISAEFSIADDKTLFHLVRKRQRGGVFFGYFDSWSAGVLMPASTDIFINQSRHQYFRESGMTVTHVKQTISAIAATETIAEHLNIAPQSPLLSLVRRSYYQDSDSEVLVDHLLALYNTELFQYQMDLKLD